MHKGYLKKGALLALLSVIAGAMGAHALKKIYPENVISIFETAVRYQFYHALALILTGILFKEFPNKQMQLAGNFFILGIIFFSGSLFLLTYLQGNNIFSLNWIGAITPIGGLLFIAGWFSLFLAIKSKTSTYT